jgi:hypothetical protein
VLATNVSCSGLDLLLLSRLVFAATRPQRLKLIERIYNEINGSVVPGVEFALAVRQAHWSSPYTAPWPARKADSKQLERVVAVAEQARRLDIAALGAAAAKGEKRLMEAAEAKQAAAGGDASAPLRPLSAEAEELFDVAHALLDLQECMCTLDKEDSAFAVELAMQACKLQLAIPSSVDWVHPSHLPLRLMAAVLQAQRWPRNLKPCLPAVQRRRFVLVLQLDQ